jgi:hypothetical protein
MPLSSGRGTLTWSWTASAVLTVGDAKAATRPSSMGQSTGSGVSSGSLLPIMARQMRRLDCCRWRMAVTASAQVTACFSQMRERRSASIWSPMLRVVLRNPIRATTTVPVMLDEHAEQATAIGDPGCLDLRVHADELGAAQLAELSVLQAAHERAPLVRRELQNRPGPVLLGVPDGDDAGQIGCHLHTAHSTGGRSRFRIACRSMRPATSSSTSASVVFGRPESTTRA